MIMDVGDALIMVGVDTGEDEDLAGPVDMEVDPGMIMGQMRGSIIEMLDSDVAVVGGGLITGGMLRGVEEGVTVAALRRFVHGEVIAEA